ncbi:hypothetical protein JNUCC0626_18255 [Lentzea sp. JNUCC 0626]|uniref:hypothetical protein n=1 Tax=Lentzea sp. JNUCC 0626 TaxID=3367513 RepID=UPI0037496F54
MSRLADIAAKIRLFYDPTREPLRRHVYTTLLGLVAFAVAAGLVTGSVATALIGPLALVLAVPAVERARAQVSPVAGDKPGKHARPEVPDDGS